MASNGNNNIDNNDINGITKDNQSASTASLYSKLLNVGLNDEMITKAITHIQQDSVKKMQQNDDGTNNDNNNDDGDNDEYNDKNSKYVENPNVIKEGYLGKESVHLKKIRQRWMVLKGKYLYSYKKMQEYEEPTEIFELSSYRTAKMCRNGKIGQFELISIKQERRVFIARNKHEMNDWIRCIKKVILFSKQFNNKCRTIRSCLCLRRLVNVIKLYSHYTGYNDSILQFMGSYKQLINDYHHILDHHLNDDKNDANCINTNKSYELLQKTMNFYCNINHCQCYIRNNRIREEDEKEYVHNQNNYNQEIIVYRDLLDTIHCSLVHGFDDGLKIKHKILQSMIPEQDEIDDNNNNINNHFDHQLMEIKQYLLYNKKRLNKVRGPNRFENNRFFININHEQMLTPLSLNDNEEKKNDDDNNNHNNNHNKFTFDTDTNKCMFGRKYLYWNTCKYSPYYVRKKYDNLKLEIMDNMFYPLEISKFIETHIKANKLLNESNVIKSIKSDGHNAKIYGIDENVSLCLENIMALIFYTDFDMLCSHFLSTYYPLCSAESEHQLIERHREFWSWSKLLNETVTCFGNTVNNTEIEKFYICTKLQYFDKFMINFNRPSSMTSKLHISTLFCPLNGIILEMKRTNFYIGELLKYFDCSFVSSFSGENEKLFIGGSQSLQLISMRSMIMNECYKEFISPFIHFQKIMNGKDILQILYDMDYLIISNLISSKIINKKRGNGACSSYIIECFDKYCLEQKVIKINLKWLYNFSNNFIHLQCPNLLLFDNLSILFRNCQIIYCQSTGVINSLYLSSLLMILGHINTNKYKHHHHYKKKLKKIVLSGVTIIKLTDLEFEKYKSLIYEKVQWIMEQTDDSILTLTKCVIND